MKKEKKEAIIQEIYFHLFLNRPKKKRSIKIKS